MSIADEPNVKTKLTYDHYVLFPSDGMRHEIIDGRHHMNPAPSPWHQTASRRIQFQLYEQIELTGRGQVFNAPIDLQLSETDVVQPDILVVLNDNDIILENRIHGVPELVIEILSPSNRRYDQELKRALYQQSGVPEFWIVDGDADVVEQCALNANGEYEVTACHEEIRSSGVDALVDLKTVWER